MVNIQFLYTFHLSTFSAIDLHCDSRSHTGGHVTDNQQEAITKINAFLLGLATSSILSPSPTNQCRRFVLQVNAALKYCSSEVGERQGGLVSLSMDSMPLPWAGGITIQYSSWVINSTGVQISIGASIMQGSPCPCWVTFHSSLVQSCIEFHFAHHIINTGQFC